MDAKITEKLKDKSFVEKLMGCETQDEVKKFLKDNGVDASDSDIKEMGVSLNDMISKFKDIPDEEFSEVSGGGLHGKLEQLITKTGMKIGSDFDPSSGTVWKGGISEKIGRNLVNYSGNYATGAMAAAATLTAYAGYKKGWPAVKALGQRRGWWS